MDMLINSGPQLALAKHTEPPASEIAAAMNTAILDQEEAVENLARMASITEIICLSTFAQAAPADGSWDDALFSIRHLVGMIDEFRSNFLVVLEKSYREEAEPLSHNQA